MLDQSQRTAILELHKKGHSGRDIAEALEISRAAVDAVIHSGTAEVPRVVRDELAGPWHEEIVAQYVACKGNLVRVREELAEQGAEIEYSTLTAYCRRHGIGHEPKQPAGQYDFKPGEEMQHDTSPHTATIGGVLKKVNIASLVLCFSRMIFIQLYAWFTRFECKLFLTKALQYLGRTAGRCMIDNTHVVVLCGTGVDMVPAPEMAAFAERLGFKFAAHEKGDANRSARVEGHFDYVQNNFLVGRRFADWEDANRQAVVWCDKVNATYSRKLHAKRRDLFATELASLKPLPIWVPEVYMLRNRIVDSGGYITVRTNRYSCPYRLIGRRMEVRELDERIEVYDGPREVARHARVAEPKGVRVTDPAHRPPRGEQRPKSAPPIEEQELLAAQPKLASYVAALKKRASGRGTLCLRRLLKMVHDYPEAPLLAAMSRAEQYGLFDLERLERLVLREIATDYFILPVAEKDPEDDSDE